MPEYSRSEPSPFWAKPVGFSTLILALSLPRIVIAVRLGALSDEAYYALWSMYPTYGYFDHPPGIAWLVSAGRLLFGEGVFPVRSLTLLAGFVTCWLLYRLGKLLWNDARVGALAGYFYVVSIGALLSFNIATPDGISTLFWLAVLWAVAEGEARGNPNWWLAAGLLAGLGLLSKYTNVFLAPGLMLYLLVRRRDAFARWQLWAGVISAVTLFAPVVFWNAQHDWISFRFQLGRSSLTGSHGGIRSEAFVLYWVSLGSLLLPPATALVLCAVPNWLLRRKGGAGLDLPLLTTLPMLAFFALHSLVNTANPNWLDPLYPPLALVAAYAASYLRPDRRTLRWPLVALRWSQIPLGLTLTVALCIGVLAGELPVIGLRNILSYGRGWDGVAGELSQLAAENHVEWADTQTYLVGSLVAYAMITRGDALPVLQTNEPFRYTFRPAPSTEMGTAPHLLLREVDTDSPPSMNGDPPLSVIKRMDSGKLLARFAVYLMRRS